LLICLPSLALADTYTYSFIFGEKKVGHLTAETKGDATTIDFDVKNNGRGPTIAESIKLDAAGLPRLPSCSHIVPLHIGEAALCRKVSDRLLHEFGLYATPINYPTVARGEERLRFTPGPLHTDAMMDDLVNALLSIIPVDRRRAA